MICLCRNVTYAKSNSVVCMQYEHYFNAFIMIMILFAKMKRMMLGTDLPGLFSSIILLGKIDQWICFGIIRIKYP